MTKKRTYPPDFCKADTMAYMLDMASSTFRDLVSTGVLPEGRKIGGLRLWNRNEVYEALEARTPDGFNDRDRDDPILGAINGKTKETRRAAS